MNFPILFLVFILDIAQCCHSFQQPREVFEYDMPELPILIGDEEPYGVNHAEKLIVFDEITTDYSNLVSWKSLKYLTVYSVLGIPWRELKDGNLEHLNLRLDIGELPVMFDMAGLISQLVPIMPRLKSFSYDRQDSVFDQRSYLLLSALSSALSHEKLERLLLRDLIIPESLILHCSYLKSLRHLSLFDINDDASVISLVSRTVNLVSLELRNSVSNAFIIPADLNFPNLISLEHLSLSVDNFALVAKIFRSAPRLRSLRLSHLDCLDQDDNLHHDAVDLLVVMRSLRHLESFGCRDCQEETMNRFINTLISSTVIKSIALPYNSLFYLPFLIDYDARNLKEITIYDWSDSIDPASFMFEHVEKLTLNIDFGLSETLLNESINSLLASFPVLQNVSIVLGPWFFNSDNYESNDMESIKVLANQLVMKESVQNIDFVIKIYELELDKKRDLFVSLKHAFHDATVPNNFSSLQNAKTVSLLYQLMTI